MARETNYVLGKGESLTSAKVINTRGGDKNPPYPFPQSRDRLLVPLQRVVRWADRLPEGACPDDQVVAEMTLHPRYISKSDQPGTLLHAVGLKVVGRSEVQVRPEAWGVDKHPETAMTDRIYVAGTRGAFSKWTRELAHWHGDSAKAKELSQIESIAPFRASAKLRDLPDSEAGLAEIVLHNAGNPQLLQQFVKYATQLGAKVLTDRQHVVGWLTFFPATLPQGVASELAKFAFVRVVRSMPRLRAINSSVIRESKFRARLPDVECASMAHRAVIFDGGIPEGSRSALAPWVTLVEPAGIGKPSKKYEQHGLAVTSSFLFGPLEKGVAIAQPPIPVDHVRVLDRRTGADLEYYDVLDRVLTHLSTNDPYTFGCLSIGPDRPIDDTEVTAWTSALDAHLAHGYMVMAVAAGNDGELDAEFGLNRIQPPSDGVNVLSVGAADSRGTKWTVAPYSCRGPGRSPGLFKPDGVSFGGSNHAPFEVLGDALSCRLTAGTSFAAPYALRVAAGVGALLDHAMNPLAIRALMVHRAAPKGRLRHADIGWGRFLEDPQQLITCDDCEAVVIYEGALPLKQHLRAAIAMPKRPLKGPVTITATLAIAPEIDPEHLSTYTRGGLTVTFRPHALRFGTNSNGEPTKEPVADDFVTGARIKRRVPEYVLRKDLHKWEPVIRATRRFDASDLYDPVFDIYFNTRERGEVQEEQQPLRYALVVTLRCEKMPDLYERVQIAYQDVLVQLEPKIEPQLRL